jgi:hypothetical protein
MDVDDLLRQVVAGGSVAGGEPRRGEYTGTKALLLAVLEDGIRTYCGRPGPLRTEAQSWVRSNRRGAFSFTVICETLGLEPDAVRQALARLGNQSTLTPRRIRSNVRRRHFTTGGSC